MCQSLFFDKVAGPACNFIKKETCHRCFPVNFAKFPRLPFFIEHLRATASVYGNALISRSLTCPEKFLVAHLIRCNFFFYFKLLYPFDAESVTDCKRFLSHYALVQI